MLYRLIAELQKEVANTHEQLARLRWAHEQSVIHGTVTDRDKEKGVRIQIGVDENGDAVKSPWLPPSQIAGARKSWSPPSIGQQLSLLCPGGDIQRAVLMPFTWSDDNPAPTDDLDADVDVRGKSRVTQKDASLKREVDGVTETMAKQSHSVTVHKDEPSPATVDDAHPWAGNAGDLLHGWTLTKDGGLEMRVSIGGAEHAVKLHPSDGVTISGFGGQHSVTIGAGGITHRSAERVTIEAAQIAHNGALKIAGSLLVGGVVQSAVGFRGNLQGVAGGLGIISGLPDATDWQ
ncbi:phage baseplate assembly protein V [Methylosinus sp. PW1]|uniref:phage baseplate assembly protein V n=1 Tax=Methylosinus sp. PW1 TaxID=107636 RepID=UPI001AEC16D2|nr:phage baseplate assembly protein V [Methylosinus sp. PW1]